MKHKHKEMKNPFVIKPYESKELFCDREKELELMLTNVLNKSDMTLMSQRRMGKTGLIFRLFDEIKNNYNEIQTIYFDIFSSRSINDFIKLFAESAIKAFPAKSLFAKHPRTKQNADDKDNQRKAKQNQEFLGDAIRPGAFNKSVIIHETLPINLTILL